MGGGFVVSEAVAADGMRQKLIAPDSSVLPHPFHSSDELLLRTREESGTGTGTIADVMRRNERHWRSGADIDAGLLNI